MTDQPEVGTGLVPAESGEISGLMELAIREKVPVEVLERLVALQERVTDRNARAEFFEALAAFQEECPEIPKSRTANIATQGGSSYSYTFSGLEDITRVVGPILKRHDLSYNWTTEGVEGGFLNVIFILRHVGGHEERSAFPVPPETNAKMSAAQKMGAALTYGRRQSMVSGLGLTTADVDTDGADEDQYITEGQLADLRAKMEEVESTEARICKTYGLAHLEALPAHLLAPVLDALEEKARKASQ